MLFIYQYVGHETTYELIETETLSILERNRKLQGTKLGRLLTVLQEKIMKNTYRKALLTCKYCGT